MNAPQQAELLEAACMQTSSIPAVPLLTILVYSEPAPQGSKKFAGMIPGKDGRAERGRLVESSKKVAPWRQDVVAAAKRVLGDNTAPLDGNLVVRMIFTLAKPASSPKRRRVYPNKKPDVSKLARSTEDALVTAGAISDDARIVEYTRLAKVYPNEDPEALSSPGARIEISRIGGVL